MRRPSYVSYDNSVKIDENIYRSTCKLHLSLTVISDVYKSFIPYETTFATYSLTQWISKLPGSFDIHCVRQYLLNFMGLAGIVTQLFTRPSQI